MKDEISKVCNFISHTSLILYMALQQCPAQVVELSGFLNPGGFDGIVISTSGSSVSSVQPIGDINGDGACEVLIGSNSTGAADYILFGTSVVNQTIDLSQVEASHAVRIDNSGGELLSSGDLNGDGLDDIIIGDTSVDQSVVDSPGRFTVVFGESDFGPVIDLDNINQPDRIAGLLINDEVDSFSAFGRQASGGQDINGDGIEDLAIGTRRDSQSNTDTLYVIFGGPELNEESDISNINQANGLAGLTISNIQRTSFGVRIELIGDVNADGIGDILISTPGFEVNGNLNAGVVTIIFGSTEFEETIDFSNLAPGQARFIYGAEANDTAGVSAGSAGDYNNDGIGDVLVGTFGRQAYVIYGTADESDTTVQLSEVEQNPGVKGIEFIDNETGSRRFGEKVSRVGDINNDNIGDLIISNSSASNSNDYLAAGSVYLFFGSNSPAETTFTSELNIPGNSKGVRFNGVNAGDNLGMELSSGCDFNGDGINDFFIRNRSGFDGFYVVHGAEDIAPLINYPKTLRTNNQTDLYLSSLVSVSDFEDQELRLSLEASNGALRVDSSISGEISISGNNTNQLILVGQQQDINTALATLIYTPEKTFVGQMGLQLDVQDVSGQFDRAEITISVFDAHSLIELDALEQDDNPYGFYIDGDIDNGSFGFSLCAPGDMNGDGVADIIIGRPGPFGEFNGSVYLINGNAEFGGNRNISEFNLAPTFSGSIFNGIDDSSIGSSIACGQDFNGNGHTDIVINSPFAELENGGRGQVYMIYGAADMNNTINLTDLSTTGSGVVFNGTPEPGIANGNVVNFPGDINADGFPDFAIGAADTSFRGTDGKVFVVFGGQDLPGAIEMSEFNEADGVQGLLLRDDNSGGGFVTTSLAGGDYNADGVADFMVGTYAAFLTTLYTDAYMVLGGGNLPAEIILESDVQPITFFNSSIEDAGKSVFNVGDINSDGLSDFLITSQSADNTDTGVNEAGIVYLIYGSEDLMESSGNYAINEMINQPGSIQGAVLSGIHQGEKLGSTVSPLGDVNGDGIDDIAISSLVPGKSEPPSVYILYGSRSLPAAIDLSRLNIDDDIQGILIRGFPEDSFVGYTTISAGDLNDDGGSDIVIGVHNKAVDDRPSVGRVYVLYGGETVFFNGFE